jgi:hypothetical protein
MSCCSREAEPTGPPLGHNGMKQQILLTSFRQGSFDIAPDARLEQLCLRIGC